MKKTTQLRCMIESKHLEQLMEAHHALSAKIVENTGFKGIWASGLSMSAAMGVRDNNEASWTQILEVLEFMSDATTIPILLDGDTGYGNFNNARRLVKKLEQRDIAGVCIEDKLFPKTNSFIKGETQPLADIDEFCYKIKAMKDTQKDDDFVVVSRVEAFIAGWGLKEALRRAEAYLQAGTDAILIHSKKSDVSEIETFMKEWGNRLPVVVVPTKYYTVPTAKLRELGISMAIWANHNLRASIHAMELASKQIYQQESIRHIETDVAPLDKVFALQGAAELVEAEEKYLPKRDLEAKSIIIVRKDGTDKLLQQQIDLLNQAGIKDILLIESTQNGPEQGGETHLLCQEKSNLNGEILFSFSDIIYQPHLIHELLSDPNDIVILAEADVEKEDEKYYISGNKPYSRLLYSNSVEMTLFSRQINDAQIYGEFIGLWKVSPKGAEIIRESIDTLMKRDHTKQWTLSDLFSFIMEKHRIVVKFIKGQWLNSNDYEKRMNFGDT
nr:phosphoenolpyruvate mutase [uncultured Bacillus sp.]